MILYLDTSALIKLLVEEEDSDLVATLWDDSDAVATALLTYTEGRAALAAAGRQGRLCESDYAPAKHMMGRLFDQMFLLDFSRTTAWSAGELAERHALRGYDAVHLASAIALAEDELVLATWDRGLAQAAREAGLQTAGITSR